MKNLHVSQQRLITAPLISALIFFGLLFSMVYPAMAAPFLDDPEKIGLFITYDTINSGSYKDHDIKSQNVTDFGIAVPINNGTAGFRTSLNRDDSYCFYEIFASWSGRKNLISEVTFTRLNDDGDLLHLGVHRKLPINIENLTAYLGPGASVLYIPSGKISESHMAFSIFLQGKANYHLTENLFVYGTGSYDFNINAGSYELGLVFTY
ncbi:MAG: hypothetical protein ACM3X9_12085 [Bacillota bacterium]